MAIINTNNLKQYFLTGFKPTQQQFWNLIDSFRHKNDPVPATEVEGLQGLLDQKLDAELYVEGFNVVRVLQVEETSPTAVDIGTVAVQYLGNNITTLLFNLESSKYIQKFESLLSSDPIKIKLFNITQKKTLIADVNEIATNEGQTKITIDPGALVAEVSEGDVLKVDFDFNGKSIYDKVSHLVADVDNHKKGNIYTTKGYLNALDGGGNSYILVDNGSLVVDHGSILDAGGTLRYVAVNPENLTNKHFGIFSDTITNWVTTASSRFNGMLKYAVNHQLTITSEIGTYFNCQLNLNSSHSGARIHFDNAVFSDLIHLVGEVSPLAYLTDIHLTGTITTYDRFGSSYCKNVTGKLNVICKEDTSIHPDGTGGKGVHIYISTENHNYGTIIVEQNESNSTATNNQAAVGIDGVTGSATATYPKNINVDLIWVKDCRTHGVLITGEGHNIESIRVDNYGDELFNTGLPSVVSTDYLGNNTQQVCCGLFTYFTNAKIGEVTINQSSFTGRKRSLTDVYIGRGLYNGTTYEYSGPKIDRIISKNPQRQSLSVCNYQREGTASIGDIHINEISDDNLMQLNASGERTDYGLIDIGFAAVDIKRIVAPNYKDVILLLQRDNSYTGTLKQATAVTVGQIIKRLVSANGTAYNIFQGSIGYILAWGDTNNKGSYFI